MFASGRSHTRIWGVIIFNNNRSVYVENNGKKMEDGIKESESEWKMVIFQG